VAVVLENILTGLLYLPFLITPFVLLIWYALSGAGEAEAKQASIQPAKTGRVVYLSAGQSRSGAKAA